MPFIKSLTRTCVAASLVLLGFTAFHQVEESPLTKPFQHGRRLLQMEEKHNVSEEPKLANRTGDSGPLFPPELFTREEIRHGAIVLYIIGFLYMFYALALVCDEFFVPSLDVVSEKLNLSPDVAGATFMAAGGSAPELFSSIIGVFIAKSDVGIGTIIGSAVFNILFVIAVCAFAAKTALSLSAWPLIRDVFFYSVSLALLVAFFIDNWVTWWEALILFLWYGAYVGFMKWNDATEDRLRTIFKLPPKDREGIERGVVLRQAKNRKGLFHLMHETVHPGILRRSQRKENEGEEMKPLKKIMIGQPAPTGIDGLKTQLKTDEEASGKSESGKEKDVSHGSSLANQHNNPNWMEDPVGPQPGGPQSEEDVEEPIDMSFPKDGGPWVITVYLISFPIMILLYCTLPDTRKPHLRKLYALTFLGSIVWIAIFSYFMVWWASTAGDAVNIPPEIMGFTFLAAGTSSPDLITSILVAKKGKGDMAVSSSIGSNIFDITVGLPFPWLLYCISFGVGGVGVNSKGISCLVSLLFFMLLLVFLSIVAFKWRMTKLMGVVMMVLYVVFVAFSLLLSYEVIGCPF